VLRRSGFWEEALWLETPGVLGEAESRICRREGLTAACPAYPPRWHRDGLGPGALWKRGPMPIGPFLSIVGTRSPSPAQVHVARTLARAAVEAGYAVASGGAIGIDTLVARAAAAARGRFVEVLPEGVARRSPRGCLLSATFDAPFTAPAALHRNTLLYGMSDLTIAIGPRRGEGGTWHGAVSALRRRLGPVAVWLDEAPGVPALLALGAKPLPSVEALSALLASVPEGSVGGLFQGRGSTRWVS